jgi:hypothetical protein
MYGFFSGIFSNTDSGTPKFFARIDFGVLATQSSRLKVVLRKEFRTCRFPYIPIVPNHDVDSLQSKGYDGY